MKLRRFAAALAICGSALLAGCPLDLGSTLGYDYSTYSSNGSYGSYDTSSYDSYGGSNSYASYDPSSYISYGSYGTSGGYDYGSSGNYYTGDILDLKSGKVRH